MFTDFSFVMSIWIIKLYYYYYYLVIHFIIIIIVIFPHGWGVSGGHINFIHSLSSDNAYYPALSLG